MAYSTPIKRRVVIRNGYLNDGPQMPQTQSVWYQRDEIDRLMRVYGIMVAKGEWRDYAFNGTQEAAIFSIYRHAAEMPLYRIEKWPSLARKQGAYILRNMGGNILKRGQSLDQLLKFFDKRMLTLLD